MSQNQDPLSRLLSQSMKDITTGKAKATPKFTNPVADVLLGRVTPPTPQQPPNPIRDQQRANTRAVQGIAPQARLANQGMASGAERKAANEARRANTPGTVENTRELVRRQVTQLPIPQEYRAQVESLIDSALHIRTTYLDPATGLRRRVDPLASGQTIRETGMLDPQDAMAVVELLKTEEGIKQLQAEVQMFRDQRVMGSRRARGTDQNTIGTNNLTSAEQDEILAAQDAAMRAGLTLDQFLRTPAGASMDLGNLRRLIGRGANIGLLGQAQAEGKSLEDPTFAGLGAVIDRAAEADPRIAGARQFLRRNPDALTQGVEGLERASGMLGLGGPIVEATRGILSVVGLDTDSYFKALDQFNVAGARGVVEGTSAMVRIPQLLGSQTFADLANLADAAVATRDKQKPLDQTFFNEMGRVIGGVIPQVAPALLTGGGSAGASAAARIAASVAFAVTEAGANAAGGYNKAIQKGENPMVVRRRVAQAMPADIIWSAVLNRLGEFGEIGEAFAKAGRKSFADALKAGAVRYGSASALEGIQEGGQTILEHYIATGEIDPSRPEVLKSMLLGAAVGGAMKGALDLVPQQAQEAEASTVQDMVDRASTQQFAPRFTAQDLEGAYAPDQAEPGVIDRTRLAQVQPPAPTGPTIDPATLAKFAQVNQDRAGVPNFPASAEGIVPQQKAAEAPATQEKEPWQMTRGETRSRRITKSQMIAQGADGYLSEAVLLDIPVSKVEGREPTPDMEGGYEQFREITQPIEVAYDADSGTFTLYSGNHRITQAEANGQKTIKAFVEGYDHKAYVEQALKDGLPVPPEVLADYPDLAAKYAPKPAQPSRLGQVLAESQLPAPRTEAPGSNPKTFWADVAAKAQAQAKTNPVVVRTNTKQTSYNRPDSIRAKADGTGIQVREGQKWVSLTLGQEELIARQVGLTPPPGLPEYVSGIRAKQREAASARDDERRAKAEAERIGKLKTLRDRMSAIVASGVDEKGKKVSPSTLRDLQDDIAKLTAEIGDNAKPLAPADKPRESGTVQAGSRPAPKSSVERYFEAKQSAPDGLLAIRVGDFYEFYGDDAEKAAEALGITVTGRDTPLRGRVPMSGVPFHSVERYATRLAEAGYDLNIVDEGIEGGKPTRVPPVEEVQPPRTEARAEKAPAEKPEAKVDEPVQPQPDLTDAPAQPEPAETATAEDSSDYPVRFLDLLASAPKAVREVVYGAKGGKQAERNVEAWFAKQGLEGIGPVARRMSGAAWGKTPILRRVTSAAEFKPGHDLVSREVGKQTVEGVFAGEAFGRPVWSDTAILVFGEPPKTAPLFPKGFQQPNFERVVPKDYDPAPLRLVAQDMAEQSMPAVLATDDLSGIASVNPGYYALVSKAYPKATWHQSGGSLLVAVQGGEIVAVVAPLNAYANYTSRGTTEIYAPHVQKLLAQPAAPAEKAAAVTTGPEVQDVGDSGTIYRYAPRLRPPSPGAVPREGLIGTTKGGKWGVAEYSRQLTPKEIADYELDDAGTRKAQQPAQEKWGQLASFEDRQAITLQGLKPDVTEVGSLPEGVRFVYDPHTQTPYDADVVRELSAGSVSRIQIQRAAALDTPSTYISKHGYGAAGDQQYAIDLNNGLAEPAYRDPGALPASRKAVEVRSKANAPQPSSPPSSKAPSARKSASKPIQPTRGDYPAPKEDTRTVNGVPLVEAAMRVASAPADIRRGIWDDRKMSPAIERKVYKWLLDNGLGSTLNDWKVALHAFREYGVLVPTQSTESFKPKFNKMERQDEGRVVDVLHGEVDGRPVWSDMHVLVFGPPPKGARLGGPSFPQPNFNRIVPSEYLDNAELKVIAQTVTRTVPQIIMSSQDARMIVAANPHYVSLVQKQYPNAKWFPTDTEGNRALVAVEDGQIVAVLMPMAKPDNLRSLITAPAEKAPATQEPQLAQPKAPETPRPTQETQAPDILASPTKPAKKDTITVDGKERPRLNSNGKPIHPTDQGIINFWRWFSDSAVVDEQGRPLVVYHGTASNFDTFNLARSGTNQYGRLAKERGLFFTPSEDVASFYANYASPGATVDTQLGQVLPVYLRIQQPLVKDFDDEFADEPVAYSSTLMSDIIQEAKSSGADGAIVDGVMEDLNGEENFETQYIVFDPAQVKSATGNQGTFSPSNPSILASPTKPRPGAAPAPKRRNRTQADVVNKGNVATKTQGPTGATPIAWKIVPIPHSGPTIHLDQITELGVKAFGQGIVGTSATGTKGAFVLTSGTLYVKKSNDHITFAHEGAHRLDQKHSITDALAGSPALAELNSGHFDYTVPANASASVKTKEQFAAFMEAYVSDPGTLNAVAPAMVKAFEASVPKETIDAIRKFSEELRRYAGQDSASKVKGSFVAPVQPKTFVQMAADNVQGITTDENLDAAAREIFDEYAPFIRTVDRMVGGGDMVAGRAKRKGPRGETSNVNDPEVALREIPYTEQMLGDAIRKGMLNRLVSSKTGKTTRTTKSLLAILEPFGVRGKDQAVFMENWRDFEAYIASMRHLDFARRQAKIAAENVKNYKDVLAERLKQKKAAAKMRADSDLQAELLRIARDPSLTSAQRKAKERVLVDAHKARVARAYMRLEAGAKGALTTYTKYQNAEAKRRGEQSGIAVPYGVPGVDSTIAVAGDTIKRLQQDKAKWARLKQAEKDLREFSFTMIDNLEWAGILAPEQAQSIKDNNPYWFAIQRVEDPVTEPTITDLLHYGQSGLQAKNPVHALVGSSKSKQDVISALVGRVALTIDSAARNRAAQVTANWLNSNGLPDGTDGEIIRVRKGDGIDATTPNTFKFYDHGQEVVWQVHPKNVALIDSLNRVSSMQSDKLDRALLNLVASATTMTHRFIVSAPPFIARNFFRDTMHRISMIGGSPLDSVLPKDKRGKEFKDAFGMGLGRSTVLTNRETYERNQRKVMKELTEQGHVIYHLGRGYHAMQAAAEESNRLVVYKDAYKRFVAMGHTQYEADILAFYAAREGMVDFKKGGVTSRKVSRFIPFFNAAIAGQRTTATQIRNNPGKVAVRMMEVAAIGIALEQAFAAMGGDDEEKRLASLSPYQREMFWNFRIGGDDGFWLSIPKGHEQAVGISMVERMHELARGREVESGRLVTTLRDNTLPISRFEDVLGGWKALFEIGFNRSLYNMKTIVPDYERGLAMDARKGTQYASPVGQGMAGVFRFGDPRQWDHAIENMTGYYGRIVTELSEAKTLDEHIRASSRLTGLTMPGSPTQNEDVIAVDNLLSSIGVRPPGWGALKGSFYDAPDEASRQRAARRLISTAEQWRARLEPIMKRNPNVRKDVAKQYLEAVGGYN